ncbi:MAG: dihydrolipoyl dehydrogenase [Deltaproteobacteria bacterium]|nr:dihydrolipoyl dehydrogenase [Deltaproteobacteria bacterium]MBW2151600.1 dihydrolipoyl dehydrogenase [Deltaproteobacteria bacterium]
MYDVVILGGGSGGYASAIRASQLGGTVALIEADEIGGTCVNRGCIPSKILLHAADLLHRIKRSDIFGIRVTLQEVNLAAVMDRIHGVTGDIRMGMEGLLGYNRVKVIRGRAVLKTPNTVSVGDSIIKAKSIIVATGSRPDIPAISGLEDVASTTDEIIDMKELPGSVLIWGAGPVELEMATLLNRFGSKVTIAMEDARILPQEDRDTSQRVAQVLRSEGINIQSRSQLVEVKKTKKGCTCRLAGNKEYTVETEKILVATRKPNTAHMGLEQAGVRMESDGSIHVNKHLETTANGIYAVGDAAGGWMLSHAASAMGIIAAENAMGKSSKFSFDTVPRGIWTDPEVGAVGLTEEEAEKRGYEVEIGDFPYTINGLAMAQDHLTGAVKVVSEAKYGKILGVHVVGKGATELVGEAVLAMELEATVREFARSIRVHPTFSETLVEAFRDAANWALYLQNR